MPRTYRPLFDRAKARHRKRAQRAVPLRGLCQRCRRRPAAERHHVNRTWRGFEDVVELLCRKCHRNAHRRAAAQ